ncbi:hypothetical protein ACVWXN_010023 [Bradyrhizobium sp. i1.4.4]
MPVLTRPRASAVDGDGVVAEVAHRIGLVVADDEIAFSAQMFQQQLRQHGFAVIQRGDVPGPGDAGINRREAVQRHQHRRPRVVQAAVDRGIDAAVIGLEDLAPPRRALAL